MESTLRRVVTKGGNQHEDDGEVEPVSPVGQYLNSKTLNVSVLAIMESEVLVDVPQFVSQLREVFLLKNHRLSSIMIFNNEGEKQWKKVEVNVEEHVIVPSHPNGLSIESYDDYFDEYLTKIGQEQLPQNRPLWEVHIINFPTSKAIAHIIFKFHHALGDGYTLMGILLSCAKKADDPSLPLTFPSTRSSSKVADNNNNTNIIISWVSRFFYTIFRGAYDFGWSFLKSTCKVDDKTPIRSGNEGVGFRPLKISNMELSLDQVKLIKAKIGGTVNDILGGIIFLGVRRYMRATNTKYGNSESTAIVLLNTRNVGGYLTTEQMNKAKTKIWGNHFGFLHIVIPELSNSECSDPLNFVYEAQKQITSFKTSPSIYLTAQSLEIIRKCRGHEAGAEFMHRTVNNASLLLTNMIGPIERMALADHPIKGTYFVIGGVPQSLQVTIMSYMQTVRIGLSVEKDFIDSQRLESCIKKAFELIYEAATKNEYPN